MQLSEGISPEKGADINGHHIQFNVVSKKLLMQAQKNLDEYIDLIVRVAGYFDFIGKT